MDDFCVSDTTRLEGRDARIAEMMETEKAGAVEEVRALVHECQLTEQNMFPASGSKAKSFVAMPRFRAPETGATRIGRSKPPNWINGKNGRQFLIEKAKS